MKDIENSIINNKISNTNTILSLRGGTDWSEVTRVAILVLLGMWLNVPTVDGFVTPLPHQDPYVTIN